MRKILGVGSGIGKPFYNKVCTYMYPLKGGGVVLLIFFFFS